jgi:hypothetical protein
MRVLTDMLNTPTEGNIALLGDGGRHGRLKLARKS